MAKIALAFSGGKDSLACFYKLRKEGLLENVTAIFVNTGKCFPEQLEIVEEVRAQMRMEVVCTDRERQNRMLGLPADIVPVDWTHVGQQITGEKPIMVQSYLDCCAANIGHALHNAAVQWNFKFLIRGQRLDEKHKSPARDGDIVAGVRYVHPIENWTEEQVLDFIKAERGSIPTHYFLMKHTSMDCYDCSAYRKDTTDVEEYAKRMHPILWRARKDRMELVDEAVRRAQEKS
jgi:3'-phosphoadenosine 5'-phosphosulfate sulfotransferase (PAPS reductase)/FAD synthetase